MQNTNISNSMIGFAGEYYVCAELCRRNILALLTPKNNPLFDIMATSPDGKRTIFLQVKTMSLKNQQGWKLKRIDKENNPSLYVILVNMLKDGKNDFYIYEHDNFAERLEEIYSEYISKPKRDGNSKKEVSFRWFDLKNFNKEDLNRKNAWKLLGL